MVRIIIAAVLGGIVFFMWGFVVHMVLHMHPIEQLPNEQAFADVMREMEAPTGVYFVPGINWAEHRQMDAEQRAVVEENWTERVRRGPIALMYYTAEGSEPMPPSTFAVGLLLFILAAGVASLMLSAAGPSVPMGYLGRAVFITGFGVVIALFSDLGTWNWWHAPLEFSKSMAIDHVVGWALAGLVIAAVVKPRKPKE